MKKNAPYELPEDFSRRIGLKFNDGLLLYRALTHRSFLNEHADAIEDNQRLEFLGDAVLGFIVGAWLYNAMPEMPEGELTKYRSALVHTEQLASFAREIDLGRALRLGRGEIIAGGRAKTPILCDAFEALIGALYLDQGLEAVRDFLRPIMTEALDDIVANRKGENPKSQLQEILQSRGLDVPRYVVVQESGPDHAKIYEIEVLVGPKTVGHGKGSSKHAATKDAALNALSRLGFYGGTVE